MRQLRDADFNIRLLATEGFCKILLCESTDKPMDFIARLMLLQFEKIVFKQLPQMPRETVEATEKLHTKVKLTIEQFLSQYVRLSMTRCTEV